MTAHPTRIAFGAYVNERTGTPQTPAPDDWCRNCHGQGYTIASLYEAAWSCDCCNGTGWQGVKFAPVEPDNAARWA